VAPTKGHTVTRWRLERLRDQDTREQYHEAVRRARQSTLLSVPEQGLVEDQAVVDAAAQDTTAAFEAAEADTIGTQTVVHGVTKCWVTPELKAVCERRREAYRRWLAYPRDVSSMIFAQRRRGQAGMAAGA
jgi:hypothetical protein